MKLLLVLSVIFIVFWPKIIDATSREECNQFKRDAEYTCYKTSLNPYVNYKHLTDFDDVSNACRRMKKCKKSSGKCIGKKLKGWWMNNC
ncbi:unnamed protein product [Trichobilharzia szidati]|nr:unnamed protein product [Trichobilharzia szidati]